MVSGWVAAVLSEDDHFISRPVTSLFKGPNSHHPRIGKAPATLLRNEFAKTAPLVSLVAGPSAPGQGALRTRDKPGIQLDLSAPAPQHPRMGRESCLLC